MTPHESMILAIEDDETARATLEPALKTAGFADVAFARDGNEGLALAHSGLPALVIIDIVADDPSAPDICCELRKDKATHSIPVIIISALDGERDVLKGFEAGADDYVARPFSAQVLAARVRAILRRCGNAASAVADMDGLALDDSAHTATLDGTKLALTPTEYDILHLLTKRRGRVWTRQQIIDAVRGCESEVTQRSVDVQLVGLRRKLGRWASHVESVRSIGYRIA